MPRILNPELTLTREGENVTVNVQYKILFSPFERHLARLGLKFLERIFVIGVDPPEATSGTTLTVFIPLELLPVTDGNDIQTISRNRSMTVSRSVLDEDQNPIVLPDALSDEIRCKIRIQAHGIPPTFTEAFTNQEVLDLALPPLNR